MGLQENGIDVSRICREQHAKLTASAAGVTNGHRLLLDNPFIFWTRLNFAVFIWKCGGRDRQARVAFAVSVGD